MNFLENFAIPQSAHHIELLYGLLVLTFLLFVPYISLVTGSLILSLHYNKKGKRTGDEKYYSIAKRIIDIVTFNKSISFALGLIPLLSIIFSYSQLLQGVNSGVPEYLLFALIMLMIAIITLYTYKYSFHLKDILSSPQLENGEAIKFRNASQKLFNKTGNYALWFFIFTAWLFWGAVSIARESSLWDNSFVDLFFTWDALVKLAGFIVVSIFITSITLLYTYFRANTDFELEDEEKNILSERFLKTALLTMVFIPFFLLADLVTISGESLAGNVFVFSLFALISAILISIYLYYMIREKNTNHVTSVLFLSIFFVLFFIVKDQVAFETSSKTQLVKLSAAYDEYKTDLLKKHGSFVETISGADIFNGRCVACHAFDKKIVGPPYNTVLSKYEGDVDKLVKFVLNPVKVNPDYPSMPNQGLKPNEAKAVAEYILSVYSSNK